MKLLLYSWNANNEQVLADNLIKAGFEVAWFRKECRHYTRDMELAMEMIPFIHAQGAEAVISFNYFPIVSMICNTCQIPYYAWVYDCPHFTLYAKQVALPCNHIGIFDREMVRRLREDYGIDMVYHAPLAVDTDYFGKATFADGRQEEREKYRCDISFVGSLYANEYNYYDDLFDETDEAIDSAIGQQCFDYREDYLGQAIAGKGIDPHKLQARMEKKGLMLGEDYFAKAEDILLSAVLEKKVTVEERRILLTEIARLVACDNTNLLRQGDGMKKNYEFRLYTGSVTKNLPELDQYNFGTVDYHTQMPLVFAGSRINLNISLRSIHSGIPLRVLDIMACGGFVLSNWQPEIAKYFADGVEIVTFDSLEDCLSKTAYYLTHEEERRQIAANGKKKVREEFSYQIGLDRLFC